MNDDEEEYIAYRHDKYTHANQDITKLEEEFPDEKDHPDFKWNQFVYDYHSANPDISFKRVKRDDEEEAPPPAEDAAEPGGDEVDDGEPPRFITPIIGITVFFTIVLIVGPLLVRKGPNKGIVQSSIMLTAFCMWIFWVTVYIGQMNPLMGPRLDNTSVAWIAFKLGNPVKPLDTTGGGD
ncbi:uncharacterized protein [Epargyreus clarus]|uniref:uncharacterized protein n=1 Tax=Epargyreus clarus TaxID=520877 RepID=UPI003C2C10DC